MTRERSSVHVLASGFEPFAGRIVNASWAALRTLGPASCEGVRLTAVELPVSRRDAADRLLDAWSDCGADAIVMFGEACERAQVTPERVAINIDDYRIADNRGAQPRNEPIVASGPVGYFSTLPLDAMIGALEAEAIPCAMSNTAGTYLCNHVFYRVMHALAVERRALPAGFVHLPCLEHARDGTVDTPPSPMSADELSNAVRICVQQAANAAKRALKKNHPRHRPS